MERPVQILIVEDSATQALRLQMALENEGWEVRQSATAESALEELNRGLPDLIVADYYLQGMDGGEMCGRIRARVDSSRVPILMLTAEQTPRTGADDYLAKTEPTGVLVERIRRLIPAPGTRDSDFRGSRLLAIDDSPTHLEYLCEALRCDGYDVTRASSGAEGVRALAAGNFDCVLVDLVMPEMDGIEVCRRIRGMRPGQADPIAVIMLTARENRDDMTRGLDAGADDFVGKSSDLAVLRARIQALLRRRFFQEENRRIHEELKSRELEAMRTRAEKEAAEVRAAMAEKLAEANRELAEANRKLKETQAHLIHTEKMASLGQLVAGIAHEINNPLAFVLNNHFTVENALARIAADADSGLSEPSLASLGKARARLGEMKEGLTRVKELVTDLRTFSRLDQGEFKRVDIHESIDSAVRFLQHRMKGRIEVVRQYGADRHVYCAAGQLNQVVTNLVANAVDAIEGEGKIILTSRNTDSHAVISVRDTGKGIPPSIRDRIFDPFFTTKPVGQGTGLGLAISWGIVQAHHGAIEVNSEEGRGTEFTVRIPLDLEERIHENQRKAAGR